MNHSFEVGKQFRNRRGRSLKTNPPSTQKDLRKLLIFPSLQEHMFYSKMRTA